MDTYDKVIGYEDIKVELRRISDVIKNPEKYKKLGVSISKGTMLYGEPGVGKTLLANCFIEDTGRKKFTIRKNKANGDFVDYISEIFKKAVEQQPSIVFLDDIDKYSENSSRNSDAEEFIAIQSGIDMIREEGRDVYCIGTCNDIDNLPCSLIRAGRFDNRIEICQPTDLSVAAEIIAFFLKDKNVSDEINPYEIARLTEGKTCAELETVVNEAGIYAGYAGKDQIEQEDIIKACLRIIFDAPESIEHKTESFDVRMDAIHEAGHVVVSEVLHPGLVSVSSIKRHTGNKEGVTCVTKQVGCRSSFKMHEETIVSALGGMAATEIVCGTPDLGADADLEKAYDQVYRDVSRFHLYGFDSHEEYDFSEYWKTSMNHRVTYELERYYRQAKQILIENREFLDVVIESLLEKQTLTFKDIAMLRDSIQKNRVGQGIVAL